MFILFLTDEHHIFFLIIEAEDEGRCPRMMYNCGNNACILRRQVCDGVSNCYNGSDENCCKFYINY